MYFRFPFVPAPIRFSALVKAYWRAAEKLRNFCAAIKCVLPVYRNLWSEIEKISISIWACVLQRFRKKPAIYINYPISFYLIRGENSKYNSSSENHHKKVKNQKRLLVRPRRTIYLKKSWILPRDPILLMTSTHLLVSVWAVTAPSCLARMSACATRTCSHAYIQEQIVRTAVKVMWK